MRSAPMTIVVGNEKGGTGKSTTAIHIAVAALHRGWRVGALDLDARQGTMSRYFANRARFAAENHPVPLPVTARPEEPPPTADEDAARDAADRAIDAAMAEMAECDIVIVDTPGSATPLSRMGHERADVLLTPVNDSLIDLDVLAELDPVNRRILAPCVYARMAWEYGNRRIIEGRPPMDWVVLRNRLGHVHSHNRRDVDEVLEKLAQRIGFRQAPGLGERVVFRALFLQGLTVLDLPAHEDSASRRAARDEIDALMDAIGIGERRAANAAMSA
jgi:chromosome partitioning protein